MTAAARRHTEKAGRQSFKARPMGIKEERANGTAATEHTTHGRRSGGQAEGRKEGGERDTRGLAPGGAVEEGNEEETRQQGGNRERADRKKI